MIWNIDLTYVQTKIYLSWCEIRISILRKLGLQDEFMSYNTLVKLQDQAKEGNEDAIKQIKTLWETMKKGRRGCNMAIWAQVLEALDTHQGCIQRHIGHDWGHDSEVYNALEFLSFQGHQNAAGHMESHVEHQYQGQQNFNAP